MNLPAIAPLTRREAKAARVALDHFRKAQDILSPDSQGRAFVDAAVAAVEAALEEYHGRSWISRAHPQPAGHRTRLREWMLEVQGYTEARLAELPGG